MTTSAALKRIKQVVHPAMAGGKRACDNGNGSLMRILPLAFYVKDLPVQKRFAIVTEVSAVTHAHKQSIISCCIYIEYIINLLKGKEKKQAYEDMKKVIRKCLSNEKKEQKIFQQVLYGDIASLSRDEIKSGGYVVDTLGASLWCFLNGKSYKDVVLSAVNLGGDTDTTGAVAGGLAGIYYGFEDIPKTWVKVIARKDDIKKLADKLNKSLQECEEGNKR